MNAGDRNSNGWGSSRMYMYTMSDLKNALPADLQTVLQLVTKYTDNMGNSSGYTENAVTATTQYLFLLSEFEVQGVRSFANPYEQDYQAQYDYFKANSKIVYNNNNTDEAVIWRLRSPVSTNSKSFVAVDSTGKCADLYASYSLALLACFVV